MPPTLKRPFVLVLSGSTRTASYTRALARAVAEAIELNGGDTHFWDAQDPELPMANPAFHKSAHEHPDGHVRQLEALARSADAFVLASPVYHNSYSGVLKNLLDHLNIPHFLNKPVGLVSHGGDRSTQPVDHLRVVVRGLKGVATPTHVCTRDADYDERTFVLTDKKIKERVVAFARELVMFAVQLGPLQIPSYDDTVIERLKAQRPAAPTDGAVAGERR